MNSPNDSEKRSYWTLTRIGLLGSAILLVVAIASAYFQEETNISTDVNPGELESLPAEVMQTSFNLLDGESRKLSDYSGKVLVIDLWATWCGPCRQEIPHLIEMAKEYKSKGVEVIGLSTEDPETDAELVREFSKEFKINYPIGWAERPLAARLMNGKNGIPQKIIIGRDGKVKKHFVGFHPMLSIPQMRAVLDEAVAEE
ncbi:MAG: TlpA family protein disulfide reductase [Acidobacteria bacterium]|nr:TlpA family protein disulfide reductase [Acidobacteriota bacterium]MCI0660914.1 TlpA family protein disulfide reductase [Acidobacteriota bacterium]